MNDRDARRGARAYNRFVLAGYDLVVLALSNPLAWRCPTPVMLDAYRRDLRPRHLDVGPGTGWYLARAPRPSGGHLTLFDLNENSLAATSARLGETPHTCVGGNVLEPLPSELGPFDSIAVNYLVHCLPGTLDEKGVAFSHLAEKLTDDGVLFGATILGRGVRHNLLGRRLMATYNAHGVFSNREDDEAGLRRALEAAFDDVEITVRGVVALFRATRPRR